MNSSLIATADAYFQTSLKKPLAALLKPIDPAAPAGRSLRSDTSNGTYRAVEDARRADDASLPLGSWNKELKRADWGRVSQICVLAIAERSKDLQLAAWLLEARIRTDGFSGIAPCLVLLEQLCAQYWDDAHPVMEDGDTDFRANIFLWMNTKLLPALRSVTLFAAPNEKAYCWADWEQARLNEQVRASSGARDAAQLDGATLPELQTLTGAIATVRLAELNEELDVALEAIAALNATLDEKFGRDAPSLSGFRQLLAEIHDFLTSELSKRGVRKPALEKDAPLREEKAAPTPAETAQEPIIAQPAPQTHSAPCSREALYAQLDEIAEKLARLEPHSPVPYLIKRAIAWGEMNTAELYQELFLNLGGQLNIFEMLGLQAQPEQSNDQ